MYQEFNIPFMKVRSASGTRHRALAVLALTANGHPVTIRAVRREGYSDRAAIGIEAPRSLQIRCDPPHGGGTAA